MYHFTNFFFFGNRYLDVLKCKIKLSPTGQRWQYGACALHAGQPRLQAHTQNYEIITAIPLQQWLQERVPVPRHTYTAGLDNNPRCLILNEVCGWRVYWGERDLWFKDYFTVVFSDCIETLPTLRANSSTDAVMVTYRVIQIGRTIQQMLT